MIRARITKRFKMSEQKNNQPESGEFKQDASPSAEGTGSRAVPGGVPQSKPKTAWAKLKAFLAYLDEEVPAPPEKDVPDSKLKQRWTEFNAFLDSLEDPPEPEQQKTTEETVCDFFRRCGDGNERAKMLKAGGDFCWNAVFIAVLLVFLFAVTMLGTIWTLDYVREHRVSFYPARDMVEYLAAAHESLEAAADAVPAGKEISSDQFEAELIEKLKPVKIYGDEYGVYLTTSDGWYAGEHGIFIARDAEKMPPKLSWGLIRGRVFTYALE